MSRQPYIKIIEQPASKALRFRYECEGRSAGSIPGASSTPENKTYPTIQVVGTTAKALVIVSCVTKDPPYKVHPHRLVGKEGCKNGVFYMEIPQDTMRLQFSNLGIQCVKKRDVEHALKERESIKVDPFNQGFSHRNQPTSIDLNAVRLCFQVFLEGDTPGRYSKALRAVVSDPIYDKKAMCELAIVKLSDCVSYVDGGRKDIILLCEKVVKDDIQVRFYEEQEGQLVWESFADVQPTQVHKQHAIWFRTPRYRNLEVTEPVKVYIQLRRPSDGATSEPLPFELLPLDSGDRGKRKRAKIDDPTQILRHLAEHDRSIPSAPNLPSFQMNIPVEIKKEPRELSPPFGGGVSPSYGGGLSPNYPTIGVSSNAAVPNQSSPQYQQVVEMDPTATSPHPYTHYAPPQGNIMDLGNDINWNIPAMSGVPMRDVPVLPDSSQVLYDMDTRQMQDQQPVEIDVDSGTLNNCLRAFNEVQGVEALPDFKSLSLSDVNLAIVDQNMTDSLTSLANKAHDKMYQNQ